MTRDAHYWVGNLAHTCALASKADDPRPLLRSAVKEFLADRPAQDPLARIIRDTLKGK